MSEPAALRIIASKRSWIEGEAVRQLELTARLPGMRLAVGLPDLHPGRGTPIGAAFASEGTLYPSLVGNDIGCGMGLFQTELGSAVICENRDLLYEEAPDAYKKIDAVVGDLVEAGVAKVIATFRPVITYKVRDGSR